MKVTLDIDDVLLSRAKAHAKRTGRPLKADGLRLMLAPDATRTKYELPDLSVGNPGKSDPLEAHPWQGMRELIYGDGKAR